MNLSPGGPSIFNIIRDSYGFPANKAANTLLRMNIQLITAREQLIFNLRCKRNNILPKSLRLNPPIRNAQGYSIARRNGFSYLRCFIGENHKKRNYLNYQLPQVERNLRNIISEAHYHELLNCVLLKTSRKKYIQKVICRENLIVSWNLVHQLLITAALRIFHQKY